MHILVCYSSVGGKNKYKNMLKYEKDERERKRLRERKKENKNILCTRRRMCCYR